MYKSTKYPNAIISNEIKVLKESVRPQGEGEENSPTYHDFQESSNSSGGLSYQKWATCFESLIQDAEGINLFKEFLKEQVILADFYIACNGFKISWNPGCVTLAKKFYMGFIKGDKLNISKPVKKKIIQSLKSKVAEVTIFDDAQAEVENVLRKHYYPKFLKSDIYASYAEHGTHRARCGSKSNSPKGGKHVLPPLATKLVSENMDATGMTDVSCSFSFMSQSTDRDTMRAEPIGDRSVNPVQFKEVGRRRLDVTSDSTVDREENLKHVTAVDASVLEGFSRSVAGEPYNNTDGMSFTSSSRDEKDLAKAKTHLKGHAPSSKGTTVNRVSEMKYSMAAVGTDKKEHQYLAEVDPKRFFELVKAKLEALNKIHVDSSAPTFQPNNNNALFLDRFTLRHDDDHLWALEQNDTKIGEARMKRHHLDTTAPARIQDGHGRQQFFPPTTGHRHNDDNDNNPQGFRAGDCRQFGRDGSFRHANSSCFEGPSNRTNDRSFNGHRVPLTYANPYDRRFVSCAPFNFPGRVYHHGQPFVPMAVPYAVDGRVFGHPSELLRRQTAAQDFTGKKVQAWLRTNQECESKGISRDVSEHGRSMKESMPTDYANQSKAYDQRQNKQKSPPIWESQSTKLIDQSIIHRPLSCTSATSKAQTAVSNGDPSNPTAAATTTVNYYLVGDAIPFRIKVPGRNITLRQIKQILSKKGKFRYFFKTRCPDFEDGVVHEEVVDDDQVLPLWEGMVICKLDTIADDDDIGVGVS